MSNKSASLIDFSKCYGNKRACTNINFTANENSITGILGPNGAGKSTILKALGGQFYATEGSVEVFGKNDPDEIKPIVGFVPELPQLENKHTVQEMLMLQADLYGLSSSDKKKYITFAIDFCDLKDVLTQKCSCLSKGFMQRASLAKALVINPKMLILDEFSAGLDPQQTYEMRLKIKELSKRISIVFSTHHIEEAENLCDYIYIINRGKVCAEGSANELIALSGKNTLEEAYIFFTNKTEV